MGGYSTSIFIVVDDRERLSKSISISCIFSSWPFFVTEQKRFTRSRSLIICSQLLLASILLFFIIALFFFVIRFLLISLILLYKDRFRVLPPAVSCRASRKSRLGIPVLQWWTSCIEMTRLSWTRQVISVTKSFLIDVSLCFAFTCDWICWLLFVEEVIFVSYVFFIDLFYFCIMLPLT